MFKPMTSVLEEVERQYKKYETLIQGMAGLSLALIITLYFYRKWKQTKPSSKTEKELSDHE